MTVSPVREMLEEAILCLKAIGCFFRGHRPMYEIRRSRIYKSHPCADCGRWVPGRHFTRPFTEEEMEDKNAPL